MVTGSKQTGAASFFLPDSTISTPHAMQGVLRHQQQPSSCCHRTSVRFKPACRATSKQQAKTEVQQYAAAVPQQAVQQTLPPQPSQGPACKLDRNSGALERDEYGKFVQFFRQASPYIEGHRARTFVVVIPGAIQWAQHPGLSSSCLDLCWVHVAPRPAAQQPRSSRGAGSTAPTPAGQPQLKTPRT